MKRAIRWAAVVCWSAGLTSGIAQTPARPVDPGQALPAQPVGPPPVPAPTNAAPVPMNGPQVCVVADSSLRQVLQELAQNWADSIDSGPQVPLTLTNEGTLQAKIESGAVWDLVLSADLDDLKEMTAKGLILADGQHSVARNTLVIYGRKALVKDDELDWFELIGPEWKKVALGNPDLVTSGQVARRALQKHDLLTEETKGNFIYGATEAVALQAVEREEADAVFVYKTDLAKVDLPGFEIIVPKTEDVPPIFYHVALFRLAKNPALAHSFMDYLASEAAKEIWKKYGFETN